MQHNVVHFDTNGIELWHIICGEKIVGWQSSPSSNFNFFSIKSSWLHLIHVTSYTLSECLTLLILYLFHSTPFHGDYFIFMVNN